MNDLGREQAALAGKRLSNVEFTKVISSDLKRTVDTADIIVSKNKYSKGLEVVHDKRIREVGLGVFEN